MIAANDIALVRALTTYQTLETRRMLIAELDCATLERLKSHFFTYNWTLHPDGAINAGLITARLQEIYHQQMSVEVCHAPVD